MKNFTTCSLLILFIGFSGVWASPGYDDLVKLVNSKASEDIIIAYINAADFSYALTTDEIVQLKDLGASPHVIATAIQHKKTEANPAPTAPVPAQTYRVYRPGRPYADLWWANELRRQKAAEKFTNAIQFDLAGFAYNGFTLNYEHLFDRQHGLVAEGSYSADWNSHGEKAGLAYRWHWAKSMHSGFIGIFANATRFYGQTGDNGWGMMTDRFDNAVSYKKEELTVGPNIGKRWVYLPGLSLVTRLGLGISWSRVDWLGNNPAPNQIQDRPMFNSGLDAEASLGYVF